MATIKRQTRASYGY